MNLHDEGSVPPVAAPGELTTITSAVREPDNAMVDLETLGLKPGCVVLSIGACAMRLDTNDAIDGPDLFFQPIKLQSCLDHGLRVEADTLTWWLTHESITLEARAMAMYSDNAVSLPHALDAFTDWLQSRPLHLWGNSARFDLGILATAYQACGKDVPWDTFKERCYRTIKCMPLARAIPLIRIGTHHHPTHDAVTQALHLRSINQQLQLHL